MGCFLGCFGSSKDRKRRKQRRCKAIPADQNPKSQKLVQDKDDVSLVLSTDKEKPSNLLPESRGKIEEEEEPLNLSTRKKVTFDANVTTYDNAESSLLERNEKDETFPKLGQTGSTEGSDVGSYPPNYRYVNCVESDDDEVDDSDYEDENDDGFSDEEVWHESIPIPIPDAVPSRVENPVLKPVANLTQWKALKSNGTESQNKENAASLNSIQFPTKNPNQETAAVDASLSNWLVSSEKNLPDNKQFGCYNPDLQPRKSFSQGSATPSPATVVVKSIEDRPILGALTVDELKQFSSGPSSCTPKKSPGRSPGDDDMPIIGSVGSYWSETGSAQSLSSTSSYKGIPNTTSKYREDKKVNWHNTPFETRLERALNRDAAAAAK